MNYYEHHIRDYDAATSHLTWEEDLAYTRLLRWYYRKEKPIPADIKEACRQVRATSKPQRDAVESVLKEFFELQEDGWHKDTCDEAIAAFQAGEPEREVKKANEENRLKKHREERSRLFKILTDAGEHAAWNIRIETLRELADAILKREHETRTATAPETKPATPATAPATPATATQTPDTRHQYPEVNPLSAEVDSTGDVRALRSDDSPRELSPVARVCLGLKALGFGDTNPHDARLQAVLAAGLTPEEIIAVGPEARERGMGFRWVLATAEGRRRDAAKVTPLPPKKSEQRPDPFKGAI